MPSARPPQAIAYSAEVLRDVEKGLRRQADLSEKMLEVLQESHLTQQEFVGVLKDLKRVLTVKDTTQHEMLSVLKEIRDQLKRQ